MLNRVSPRYFESIGTQLMRGRAFSEHDTPGAQPVAVVNEAFVRQYIRDGNPIGKHFGIGGESTRNDLEIIGVVENAKYTDPRDDSRPMAFLPLLQLKAGPSAIRNNQYGSNFIETIELRSANDPTAIERDVRRVLAEIDPNLLVINVSTLSDDVQRSLSQETVVAILAGFFGALALVLACVGLYGLMAYVVQRRTGEIGIRIALGASSGQVIGMILSEAWAQAIAGIFIGIPLAFVTLRLVASRLFGVDPMDVQDSAIAALVLLLCITVAAFLPAYRASRVDPLVALRLNA
jgi:predicted permease